MKNPAARRSARHLVSALAVSLALLGGCESAGGLGSLLSTPTAMDLLAPAVKASAENYLSGLAGATSALSSVNGYADLLSLYEKVQPYIAQARDASAELRALSPETRANVLEAFGPRLTSTNSGFTSQVDGVAERFGLPSGVRDLVSAVELFGR
ncbi:MAG: hypothetical protein DHS20C14_03540 [Phycisphaeraceae bacterium]|nr:MAG: hypothetical protein DHS20C14_03540 [Phycisphaeraceae bacterium]